MGVMVEGELTIASVLSINRQEEEEFDRMVGNIDVAMVDWKVKSIRKEQGADRKSVV